MKADPIVRKGVENMVWAIQAPIIVWPGFEDGLPDHLKNRIPLERLALAATGETEMATDAEAVAYLHTASLVQPLSHDVARVYLHIAAKYLGKALPEDFQNEHETPLEPQQAEELAKLKRWIRKKQVEAMKEKRR